MSPPEARPLSLLDACAKHSKAASGAYDLMRELCHYADHEHRTCYPSQQTLARRMRKTERWVRILTARLIGLGELVEYPRMMYHRSALFYIPPYPDEPGYNPQPCTKRSSHHRCNGCHTANPEEGRPPTRKSKIERKRRRGRPKPATQELIQVHDPAPTITSQSETGQFVSNEQAHPAATRDHAWFEAQRKMLRAKGAGKHDREVKRAHREKSLEGRTQFGLEILRDMGVLPDEGGQP